MKLVQIIAYEKILLALDNQGNLFAGWPSDPTTPPISFRFEPVDVEPSPKTIRPDHG